MAQKTKELVKYGVIIIVIAVMLGGCKKEDKPEENTTPANNNNALPKPENNSTPLPIEDAETIKRAKEAKMAKVSELVKIAATADGWSSALVRYYGKPAAEMKLKDLEGNSLSISSLKGKKAVLVKWSTMYEPSKDMVKTLAELQKQVGDENLAVIAFSSDDPAMLKPVVETLNLPFPVAGRQRMIDPYRTIRDTPVCFFIDKEGKIQLITQNVIPPDVLNSLIEAL